MTERAPRSPTSRTRRPALALSLALSLAGTGCFARPGEEVRLSVPHAAGPPVVSREAREGPIELTGAVVGATLDVTATRTTQCRAVTTTPMAQEVDTRRYAPRLGTLGNAIGATVFVVGGVAAIPDSSSGVQTGIGVALIAIGSVFVAALITNGARAKDSHETVPAKPQKQAAAFARCEGAPAPDTDLSVTLGTLLLRGATGADGHASFDLGGLEPTSDLVAAPVAQVREGYGRGAADVDLAGTPLVAKWKAAIEQEAQRRAKRKKEEDAEGLRLQRAERQQAGR